MIDDPVIDGRSYPSRPVLDRQFGHRKVSDVGGNKRGLGLQSSGRNQAVSLVQGGPMFGEPASPLAGHNSLKFRNRRHHDPSKQLAHLRRLATTHSAIDLFDIDRRRVQPVASLVMGLHALLNQATSTQPVNQDGGIQQQVRDYETSNNV